MVGQRAAPGWPADERRRRGLARARGGGGGRGEAGKVGQAQLPAHPRAPPPFPLRCRRCWRCKPPPPPPRGSGSPPPTPLGRGARHRRMVPRGRDTARGGLKWMTRGGGAPPLPGEGGGSPLAAPPPPPPPGPSRRSGKYVTGLARDPSWPMASHATSRTAARVQLSVAGKQPVASGTVRGASVSARHLVASLARRPAGHRGRAPGWSVINRRAVGHALHDPEAEETQWIMEGGTGALLEPTDFSREVECLAGGGVAAEPECMRGIARVHRAIRPRS